MFRSLIIFPQGSYVKVASCNFIRMEIIKIFVCKKVFFGIKFDFLFDFLYFLFRECVSVSA